VPGHYRSLEHLVRYCARPAFALDRLSLIPRSDGRPERIRYAIPRHKRGTWIGTGWKRKSSAPDAQGVIHLSPHELLEPPPLAPARGPPTDWGELVQVHDDRDVVQASHDEFPVIDIHSL
jgi:hypothetical protein